MNVGTLVTEILDELNKGSSITADQIKVKLRDALSLLESQNNWAYMDRFVQFTLNIASENPRAMPMPQGLKSIEFFRWVNTDGSFSYVTECAPRDIRKVENGLADFYFKDGMEYIWLNKTPTENYRGEISYRKYTVWTGQDGLSNWLINTHPALVKYQALVLMAPFIREPELMQLHGVLLGQALKVAVDANEELEYSNQPLSMQYS